MIACMLYYIPFLLVFSYLLFASLCTRVLLSSLSFSLIRSLVSAISRSSLVTNIFNDQTVGTDSPVCSLRITTISPGVNALRLHGWRHPLLFYLFLVLFFHSASQPFSWCWCGPDNFCGLRKRLFSFNRLNTSLTICQCLSRSLVNTRMSSM